MIGILYIGQIELSPFVKKYIAVLERMGMPYEVIHWNRSGIPMPDDSLHRTFNEPLERYGSLVKKVIPFFKFRDYVKRLLKQKNYEKLIVLTTQTALLLPMCLLRSYRQRYYFDYRDTSYEYRSLYRWLVNRIIQASAYTCISSPGFRAYLTDKKNLVIAHNFQYENYDLRKQTYQRRSGSKIVMGYIGYLREYDYLIRLVDQFGQDERFAFHIHGSGDCVEALRAYAECYSNVKVFGAYDEKDKMQIVDGFDMICYNYPYSFVNYPAVANKFYDGLIQKKPMFGNLDTYSGKMIDQNYLGISLAENEAHITEKIYAFYQNIEEERFCRSCEAILKNVIEEDRQYIESIEKFLKA